LAESDDEEEEEEEEMRDDYDDKALAIATSRSRPVAEAVAKRGRFDGAFAAGALPSKRLKPLPPKPAPKLNQGRVRSSVPVAPITSVTRREKKVITTTRGGSDVTALQRAAAATARAKATLEAGAAGRASAARVVAPPAKKKKTNDLVGSILKGMRRE
jgi:hypothetical protein